jgi:hypothetical protein
MMNKLRLSSKMRKFVGTILEEKGEKEAADFLLELQGARERAQEFKKEIVDVKLSMTSPEGRIYGYSTAVPRMVAMELARALHQYKIRSGYETDRVTELEQALLR